MLVWLIAPLFAFSFAGLVWYYLSGIKIKEGWQNGQGPLARWLDERRRSAEGAALLWREQHFTLDNGQRAAGRQSLHIAYARGVVPRNGGAHAGIQGGSPAIKVKLG